MKSLPFRIKIGVTGHRNNLPDTSVLKNKITEILGIREWAEHKTIAPNTVLSLFDQDSVKQLKDAAATPVAFSMLTALAEGADRIAADAILDMENGKIEVVLPLSKEDYLEDFDTMESKEDFNRLLKKDPFANTLKSQSIGKSIPESSRLQTRKNAYLQVGKYVADNCDVLLAIWDGENARGKGGTADVIQYAQSIKRPVIIIDSNDVENITILSGNPIRAVALVEIEHFNSYSIPEEVTQDYVTNIFNEYFDPKHLPNYTFLDSSQSALLRENLFPYYAKASLLAKSYKSRFKWTGLLAYGFSSLAVIILLLSVVFGKMQFEAFCFEFILLVFIFTLISMGHKKRIHSRWLEYRFLVERIRAAPYFFLADRNISGVTTGSNSDSKVNKGQWAVMVFSEIWYQLNAQRDQQSQVRTSSASFDPGLINYVQTSWIDGQIKFQEGYFKRNDRKNTILETGGRIIFATAIAAALTHIILSRIHSESKQMHLLHNVLTVLALSLPTIAAAFEGVRRQNEYSRNKNRSEVMLDALKVLNQKFAAIEDADEFYNLLHDTDILMLSETQEWLTLMLHAELEYVT